MALNFGLLDPDAPAKIAGSVYAGQQARQEQQDRNMLRQQQAEQLEIQRQNMLGLREDRLAQAQQRKADLASATESKQWLNKVAELWDPKIPLNSQTAAQGLQYALKSGDKNAIDMMQKTVQAFRDEEQFQTEMGRLAPKAAPVSPAVSGALGSGTFGITPAPANALAPAAAPVAAPTNALTGGYTRPQIEQMLVSQNAQVREMGKNLLGALPKEPAEPSSLVELKAYMKMTPAERADFEKLQKIKATNVTATASSTTPTAKSLAAPVGARAETSLVKAEGAIGMMENANAVREALNTGNVIAGPLAGARTKFAQVLELAGAGDKEKLVATRNTIQGLASLTLESRAELKGQGQITDTETKLLERARSADIGELTIPELQQVVNVSQRLANRMWSGHQNLLKTMETDPAAADSLKYYRPTGALPQALGEGKPKAEVDKRKAGLAEIFGGKK